MLASRFLVNDDEANDGVDNDEARLMPAVTIYIFMSSSSSIIYSILVWANSNQSDQAVSNNELIFPNQPNKPCEQPDS